MQNNGNNNQINNPSHIWDSPINSVNTSPQDYNSAHAKEDLEEENYKEIVRAGTKESDHRAREISGRIEKPEGT